MKFRILEKDGGNKFFVQYRRKFWFWIDAHEYGEALSVKVSNYASFPRWQKTYKEAKDDLDAIVKLKLAYDKRFRSKKVIRDFIDLDKASDKFLASL